MLHCFSSSAAALSRPGCGSGSAAAAVASSPAGRGRGRAGGRISRCCAQQAGSMAAVAADCVDGGGAWSHSMLARYITDGRDWRAVESFYNDVVSGAACLSQLGLAPAGAPPLPDAAAGVAALPNAPAADDASPALLRDGGRLGPGGAIRSTFKVGVAYSGAAFTGWMRQPDKRSAEGMVAAVLLAAGLTELPGDAAAKARRAAAKQARRAHQRAQRASTGTAAGASAGTGPGPRQQQACGDTESPAGDGEGDVCAAGAAAADAGADSTWQLPNVACAGRTDAGVTAAAQVVSFHTWQPPPPAAELLALLNQQLQALLHTSSDAQAAVLAAQLAAGGSPTAGGSSDSNIGSVQQQQVPAGGCAMRFWSVQQVARQFHAQFSACWRRYVYLVPLRQQQQQQQQQLCSSQLLYPPGHAGHELAGGQLRAVQQAADVDAVRVNALLRHLQGRRLNFHAFARDTPKGKLCDCTLHVARASLVTLPRGAANDSGTTAPGVRCLAVELVGDRFLRRMVRVLVATALREAAAAAASPASGCQEDRMGTLVVAADRRATAAPAPALGLCFASVGYARGAG